MKKQSLLRWGMIVAVMLALIGVLLWRLYDLTILQGDHYRQLAQTRRTKEIQIAAPRGNIYDRNGILLAGTRSSYAVQGFKDDLMQLKNRERNDVLARLLRYVERDGADYSEEDFPISLNQIVYSSEAEYLKEKETPDSKVQRLLIEHNLLDDWLQMVYRTALDRDFCVSPAARALNAMSLKGSALPIKADPAQNFRLQWVPGKEYDALLKSKAITKDSNALSYLTQRVKDNENLLDHVLNHPAARKLAYDLLAQKKLTGNLRLAESNYTYVEEYRRNKAAFHQAFPEITLTSSAKNDFVTIIKKIALDRFLTSLEVAEDNHFQIPAEGLLNRLASKGVKTNLKYTIAADARRVTIEFVNPKGTKGTALDQLKKLGEENHLLDEIITQDTYKFLAEKAMFAEGCYPGISLKNWQYSLEKDQSDFLEKYSLKDKSADEAFRHLLETYEIEPNMDPVLQQGIMLLTNRVGRPGNYAFWPVNICYELSEDTVAKIEENISNATGIMVSKQPIRYYPFGESAAHILGYIGKIATDAEVQTYVKEKKYLPNEFIGKTGVEQSFESTLHGISGKETVLVDSFGNRTEVVDRQEPKAGNNIYLTVDMNLQLESEKSLKKSILAIRHGLPYVTKWGTNKTYNSPTANSAASVSVDPNNGSLLAMASYPMFDPNLFVTGISNSDWEMYQLPTRTDTNAPRPLLNLATQSAVQPGSTFKTVTSLAALKKGLNPNKRIYDYGFVKIGDRQFNNLYYSLTGGSNGMINMYDAIGKSNNYYFYILGLGRIPATGESMGVQVTVDDLEKTAIELGLNRASGLEIKQPSEAPNSIPSLKAKMNLAKTLLSNYLKGNLKRYAKEESQKEPAVVAQDIATILKWSERGENYPRTQLIADLEKLGYYAERPLDGARSGLADILKYTYFNQTNWTVADSMNALIGQGQNAYTPISMCTVASIFANGGTDYDFTLIKEIRSADNKTVLYNQTPRGRKVPGNPLYFQQVREGMLRSAQDSHLQFNGLNFPLGSKTGTATRSGVDPRTGGEYASYAWDICFAPYDHPTIATTVFMPDGDTSLNIVPIARDIVASYLKVPASQDETPSLYEGLKTYEPSRRLSSESENTSDSSDSNTTRNPEAEPIGE